MSDYIKREDAYSTLTDFYHHKREIQHESLRYALNNVPSADVVEVVRCKDCVSFRYSGMGGDNGITYCARLIMTEMQPTDFCSYGERKDNGK